MIIVDTIVASELMRRSPDPSVDAWSRTRVSGELTATAITMAEIGHGLERLPDGHRKDELRANAEEVFSRFSEDVLAFDDGAASAYSRIVAHRERAGSPINSLDAQIAAICRTHEATLATRNVDDFADTGIEVINPWRET